MNEPAATTVPGLAGSDPLHTSALTQPPVYPRPTSYVSVPEFAGFLRRYVASLIDLVIVAIVASVAVAVSGYSSDLHVHWALGNVRFNFDADAGGVVGMALAWPYFAVLESSAWQASLGKRALGIVVTDAAGRRISLGRATVRYVARYLSLFTMLIGYLIQPFTRRRQALHDLLAGTLVVKQ